MATLVLGTVGRAIGGPLGGALGALLGNRIDRAVLGGTREGPRLTELAVQTSSYGTAIPLVFGTMRVAGTVIWATDLTEHRARSGGGKGRPATTSYSYSASFAVALSGRRIARVARIWADGRLVRGVAGDLKVEARLRVHHGGEGQAADPLIASAEGAEAPAYRGIAYAVFEDMALGEFGNRLPQMTFEVVADEAGVTLDAVARVAGGRVPAPATVEGEAAAVPPTVRGLAATGSARGVLELVAQLGGGWWDGALALRRPGAATMAIADLAARADGLDGAARAWRTAADGRGAVAVSHYDPARDYQAGVQRAGRPGIAAERIEVPAVLDGGEAAALAAALLARARADRVRRTLTTGLDAVAVTPGTIVSVVGEDGTWRVVGTAFEAMAVRLTLAPVARAMLAGPAATSGAGGGGGGRSGRRDAAAAGRPAAARRRAAGEPARRGDRGGQRRGLAARGAVVERRRRRELDRGRHRPAGHRRDGRGGTAAGAGDAGRPGGGAGRAAGARGHDVGGRRRGRARPRREPGGGGRRADPVRARGADRRRAVAIVRAAARAARNRGDAGRGGRRLRVDRRSERADDRAAAGGARARAAGDRERRRRRGGGRGEADG
jgi:hypothetical protein